MRACLRVCVRACVCARARGARACVCMCDVRLFCHTNRFEK